MAPFPSQARKLQTEKNSKSSLSFVVAIGVVSSFKSHFVASAASFTALPPSQTLFFGSSFDDDAQLNADIHSEAFCDSSAIYSAIKQKASSRSELERSLTRPSKGTADDPEFAQSQCA